METLSNDKSPITKHHHEHQAKTKNVDAGLQILNAMRKEVHELACKEEARNKIFNDLDVFTY